MPTEIPTWDTPSTKYHRYIFTSLKNLYNPHTRIYFKIMKDIINRNHVLNGRRVHYVPGWDCHGLPIELKALSSKKHSVSAKSLKPAELRKIAKIFAYETIAKQRLAFKSWGVMADWEKQFYLTLDPKYVQKQIRLFFDLFEKGLVYRDMKPVYWSPSSGYTHILYKLFYDMKIDFACNFSAQRWPKLN